MKKNMLRRGCPGIWNACILIAVLVSESDAKLPNIARGIRNKLEEEGAMNTDWAVNNVVNDNKIYVFLKEVMPTDLWFILDPFDKNSDIKTKARWTQDEFVTGNCRDLITPKSILVEEWATNEDLSMLYVETYAQNMFIKSVWSIPISTETNSSIRTEANCNGCSPSRYPGTPFYLLSKAPGPQEVLMYGKCDYCKLNDCITTCPNGMYASDFANNDKETDQQINPVSCIPCTPGTWNTCWNTENCVWNIPEYGHKDVGAAIIAFPDPPVKHCFPCEYSRTIQLHYANTPKSSTLAEGLDWYCAGGESPPRSCYSNQFSVTATHDKCECKPGTYLDATTGNTCLICQKGHYCIGNTTIPCPKHQYQPSTGMSSCKNCVETGDETGWYKGCGEGTQLQYCDPAYPESQDRVLEFNCLVCSKCRKKYTAIIPEMRDCYKNTN